MELSWSDTASVFSALAGSWRFHRTITPHATMAGEAVFSHSGPEALAYHEQGELLLVSGQSLPAERRYIFRAAEQGFAVFFAEPPFALFHEIVLSREEAGLVGRATHGCGDDLYESEYRFGPDGGFCIRHAVSGPRKGYISTTAYRRA